MYQLAKMPFHFIIIRRGIVRVDAHASEYYAGIRFRQRDCGTTGGKITAGIDHARNATSNGCLNNAFAVGIETGGVKMCMTIDKQ